MQVAEAVEAGEAVAEVDRQPLIGANPLACRLVFRVLFFRGCNINLLFLIPLV